VLDAALLARHSLIGSTMRDSWTTRRPSALASAPDLSRL
jgi:hypothetical protein